VHSFLLKNPYLYSKHFLNGGRYYTEETNEVDNIPKEFRRTVPKLLCDVIPPIRMLFFKHGSLLALSSAAHLADPAVLWSSILVISKSMPPGTGAVSKAVSLPIPIPNPHH
jgi:hypothetical protein